MTPTALAADLRDAIDTALTTFAQLDEAQSAVRPAPGKWCAREVLGHLIDSACNNHRRFVVGQGSGTPDLGGYEQDEWVARQRYADRAWCDLVGLWTAYNRHLAHVIATTPVAALGHSFRTADGAALTLGFVVSDYVRHLRHHLAQIHSMTSAIE